MQNLIALIIRYHALLLFLFLQLISWIFIFSHNNFQRTSIVNASNSVSGNLFAAAVNIEDYFHLKSINDSLVEENAKLLALVHNYEAIDTNRFLQAKDSTKLNYSILQAKVIRNTIEMQDNRIVLNKGMVNGVSKMMAVVSNLGVIGVTKDISHEFTSVISILSTKLEIPAKIKSIETEHFGFIQWDGKDPHKVQLKNIFNYLPVKVGDTVLTSGYSSIFPEGEMIGTVSEIENDESKGMHVIWVKLSANLKETKYVYVIRNEKKESIEPLSKGDEE